MIAIVEISKKQYKVQKGDVLHVEKIEKKEGESLTCDNVLLKIDGAKTEIGTPYLKGASVTLKITGHGKDDKVRVFKKQPKKRMQVLRGHRQPFTTVEVTAIK
jgi:large subunit ribosomal protein L21